MSSRVSVETSKPKRLVRHNGRWILEIECLVSLPDNVLRPTIERIEGDDVILYHLESSASGQVLATAASRLLRSFNDPNDERAFEVRHGAWVPAMVGDFHDEPKGKKKNQDVSAARTGEVGVRTEMATMALAFERLSRRLTETERKQMQGELPQEIAIRLTELEADNTMLREKVSDLEVQVRVLLDAGHEDTREAASKAVSERAGRAGGASRLADGGVPALNRGDDPQAADGPTATRGEAAEIPAATKRREAAPAAGPPKAVAEAAPPPGVEDAAPDELDEVPDPEAITTAKPLLFPTAAEVDKAAKTLLGPELSLTAKDKGPNFNKRGADPFYMSRLVDDAGLEVGAMVADLAATIALGGKLMMIPQEELDAMLASKTPSEDVISAMSEVFNTLSGGINAVPDGLRVKVNPLEQLDVQAVSWAVKCGHRVNFDGSSGGTIAFVARNAPPPPA